MRRRNFIFSLGLMLVTSFALAQSSGGGARAGSE
jgi:hypothetical protein